MLCVLKISAAVEYKCWIILKLSSLYKSFEMTSALFNSLPEQLIKNDFLICIHGFLGGSWNMHFLEKSFKKEGWLVINWEYSSRSKSIEDHAESLVKELIKLASEKKGQPIHFVAHSMGSLVLRAALNNPLCPEEAKQGKAVLMAPPNQGACWGRYLGQFALAKKIAKELAGRQLMTEKDFKHLGDFPPSKKVYVIAGNLGFNPFIPGENDGVVAVSETFLNSPHEHIVIKRGHNSIVFSRKAYALAKAFLERN